MSHRYLYTQKSTLKTSSWTGGTTTQLAIFPSHAEYTKFNFDFRISYATVEVDESTFTFMPGVTRHLMILKGSLQIDHIDRYQQQLQKFDTDIFNGEWPTKAKGRVTDFNLMTRGKTTGLLETLILSPGVLQEFLLDGKYNRTGFYLFNGYLQIELESETIQMNPGDFILFTHELVAKLVLVTKVQCEIIISKIAINES